MSNFMLGLTVNSNPIFLNILIIISGFSFFVYGILCISGNMESEFKRFGLSKWRNIVGILELLGGLGSLIGLRHAPLLLISSFGLSLLMLLGIAARLKVKDNLFQMLPAFFLMLINAIIFYANFTILNFKAMLF
jgi:hypothetical protein